MRRYFFLLVLVGTMFCNTGCEKLRNAIANEITTYNALGLHIKRSTNGDSFPEVKLSTMNPVGEYLTDGDGNAMIEAYDQASSILVNIGWVTSPPFKNRSRDYNFGLEKGTRYVTMYLNDNPYDSNYKLSGKSVTYEDGSIQYGTVLYVPLNAKETINVGIDITEVYIQLEYNPTSTK